MPEYPGHGETMSDDLGFFIKPFELKIEITKACNLRCSFCYLGDTTIWSADYHMPEKEVIQWIDWAVKNRIPAVRFTGGEATMHPKIKMFCDYAYLQNRWIILNTNAVSDDHLYDELIVNDLRVSVPTLDSERLDEITGGNGVLKKKLSLIERNLADGKRQVFMLTVLMPELIGKLEPFVKLLQELPGLIWLPLRFESSPTNSRPLTRPQMQALAEEMSYLMDRYPDHAKGIYLAAPFCSVRPTSLGARVFHGKTANCGPYAALNVNFTGNLTACFGICELYRSGSLEEVKKDPKLHDSCSLSALPRECRECKYVQRCAGGCRKPSGLVGHTGKYIDYLARFARG